jgi:hypothetical protein
MKLTEFKTSGKSKNAVLVLTVADQTGAMDYELRIAGPPAAVKRIFSKSDFSVTIDTKRSAKDSERELAKYRQAQAQEFAGLAKLENTRDLHRSKRPVPEVNHEKSVFVSLQQVRGKGTFWVIGFPYVLFTGWNILVLPPPVMALGAEVIPLGGDQDLFLNRFFGPLLASSTRGGTLPDTVFYPAPVPVALMIRIFGFASGTRNFAMVGKS